MPSIPFRFSVAAGTTVANALAGSQFEFLGAPSRVQIYLTQDGAVGIGEAEVFFGQEIQLPQGRIPIAVGAGQGPKVPDDVRVDDFGAPGDRIVIRLLETGGALAAVIRGLVQITPIPIR